MWKTVRRIGGSVTALVLALLAFGDAPEQLKTWKAWWVALWALPGINWGSFWAGNGGRGVLVFLAIVVGLIAWDVPQRIRARWRVDSNDPSVIAAARKTRVRSEISNKLRRLYDDTARHAIGGAMGQSANAIGFLRKPDYPVEGKPDVLRLLTSDLIAEVHQGMDAAIRAVPNQSPTNDDELVVLLRAWGDLFIRYQQLVRAFADVHQWFGLRPWSNIHYAEWRPLDERLIEELKVLEHAEGCQHLAVRLKDAGWGEQYRPVRPLDTMT